jgi:two-component system, chemotaxis family, protein-glutamate methylesterase/glutaminase
MDARPSHVVVIGASAGGVSALIALSQALPRFFPAPVCVVQHVGPHRSLLPELLRFRGPNHALHAEHGQRLSSGTLHIAPPDHHMLLDGMTVQLTRGPRENHARPAIDPLFRSAALSWGPRAIGIVLTGQMDDGTAGLKAIKDCGGIAIVQDPDTATEPEMPRSALRHVAVDHCVPLEGIAPLLQQLVGQPPGPSRGVPQALVHEVAINRGDISMDKLLQIAAPSPLTCPDCGGSLWEVKETQPLRYRCHTGHAYAMLSLAQAQAEASEDALWNGVRALREREMLLRRMANIANAAGDARQAEAGQAEADRLRGHIHGLLEMTQTAPAEPDGDADPQA